MMSLPVMDSTVSPAQHLPLVNKWAVPILLECFLVETKCYLKVHNVHLKLMAISGHDKYFTKKKMAELRQ